MEGKLSAGHARALLSVNNPEAVAQLIIAENMSVREAEGIVQDQSQSAGKALRARSRVDKDPDTIALERTISDVLGLKVTLDHRGETGEMKIRYNSLEQLDDLCRRLRD
jgi:ParB family chromosome partitioning protein